MENQTLKHKIQVLEEAFVANAGTYYNVNLTKNIVPDSVYQVMDGIKYSLNELVGMEKNVRFTDMIAYWGNKVPQEEKQEYFEFLSVPNLLHHFSKGETHISHRYWTTSIHLTPMLAEQHIIMYEDEENGDILAIAYILDRTSKFKEKEYKKKLEENIAELNREQKILDALVIDYTSVYYCDLLEDSLSVITQGKSTNGDKVDKEMASDARVYSLRMKYYYDHFVIKESALDFEYKFSAEFLMNYLKDHRRFSYRFRTVPNQSGQQYFEVQFVRVNEEDSSKVLMGYRYIDDILAEQEKKKVQLENALAEARLNSEIINSISRIYWLIYRMDLITGDYEEISAGQEVHRLTGKRGITEEVFREVRENIVAEEYQDMMKVFLDTTTLSERLSNTDSVAIEYRAANGSWHRARFIVKKRNDRGVVTNVLYVVRLINDEKEKENEYKQKLLESAEEARRANIAKTDFLRRMSHDIRTPINGIQGMISIADHYSDDIEKLTECRRKVKEAAGFLAELVNNILDMNKLESGRVVLENRSFDLYELLLEVNNVAEINGASQNLQMFFDSTDVRHTHLKGSPVHLKQILQNIAGNAVKYNKVGGTIHFSTREISCENGTAVFEFICADTGCGMSQEFMEHAFEPFAQERENARTSYMGTGLGLSITKELVDLMSGKIQVESEPGVGTKFTITIPFEVDIDYKKIKMSEDEEETGTLSGIKVLLTEDNELNMEIAKFILEEAGIEVTTATNGKEAVDMFCSSVSGTFDMIFMDIMMPVMDGLTATRKIRALDREDAKTVPIIAMTANAFVEDKESSKEAGMNEHLSKPLDEKRMLTVIRKYFSSGS